MVMRRCDGHCTEATSAAKAKPSGTPLFMAKARQSEALQGKGSALISIAVEGLSTERNCNAAEKRCATGS